MISKNYTDDLSGADILQEIISIKKLIESFSLKYSQCEWSIIERTRNHNINVLLDILNHFYYLNLINLFQ